MTLFTNVIKQVSRKVLRPRTSSTDSKNQMNKEISKAQFIEHFGEVECQTKSFYNIGAGDWRHPFFKNLDITHPHYPLNNPDLEYNIFSGEPLPIAEASAHIIYFSHVNEHVSDSHNAFIFKECIKALKDKGCLRIVFPDMYLAYKAYKNNDRLFFTSRFSPRKGSYQSRIGPSISQLFIDFFASWTTTFCKDRINNFVSDDDFNNLLQNYGLEKACDNIVKRIPIELQMTNPGVHMNWLTFEKIKNTLCEAGFKSENIFSSAYLQSQLPPLRNAAFFDRTHPYMSGYIEAFK